MVKKSVAAQATKAKPTKKAPVPVAAAPVAKPSIVANDSDSSDSDSESSDEEDQEDNEKDSDAEAQDESSEGSGGRTMEEKLQDMKSKQDPTSTPAQPSTQSSLSRTTATTSTPKHQTPKSQDLQQSVLQALHTNDTDLLSACLLFTDSPVIRNTIRRVPTAYVTPLLNTLLTQYQRKPNQSTHLVEWIKAILLIHSTFLLTNQDIVKKLSDFYGAVDARVPIYKKVMNLSGRLDLIMNQIEMRRQYETQEGEDAESVGYVEDEEHVEEEDLDQAMDGEDDEGDDDLVGEADAFDDEENGDTDEEELESDMSEDDDDVSDDEE
ncbi:Small subunit (SSU) processome component [Mortierella sp. AD031]|nr:Small subunit (SSU) processome component [Mortierella sp. AD031]KAG0211211.1 Small subunit (SSU) processome component [Mortierella sp. NVP41]